MPVSIKIFPVSVSLSLSVLKVHSGEPCHLNCDTLEQTLTKLGLQQYLEILQAENMDMESLVIHKDLQIL